MKIYKTTITANVNNLGINEIADQLHLIVQDYYINKYGYDESDTNEYIDVDVRKGQSAEYGEYYDINISSDLEPSIGDESDLLPKLDALIKDLPDEPYFEPYSSSMVSTRIWS